MKDHFNMRAFQQKRRDERPFQHKRLDYRPFQQKKWADRQLLNKPDKRTDQYKEKPLKQKRWADRHYKQRG